MTIAFARATDHRLRARSSCLRATLALGSLFAVFGCGARTTVTAGGADGGAGTGGAREVLPAGTAGNVSGAGTGAGGSSSEGTGGAAPEGACATLTAGGEQQRLSPFDGGPRDRFGVSVALDGDTALVGAYAHDGDQERSGAVYAFSRTQGRWAFQYKLAPRLVRLHDGFGTAVSLSGNTAVVTAPGNAYVFERTGSVWMEQQKLVPDDGTGNPQEARRLLWDSFGGSVAIDHDTVFVGAAQADDNGDDSGSTYVFVRSVAGWIEQQKLLPSDGAAGIHFGAGVSVSGDTALIGASGSSSRGVWGAVYVFARVGGHWIEQQKLSPRDGALGDGFGSELALSGDTAFVGAVHADDRGTNSGAAYVFARGAAGWAEQQKLMASDGAEDDWFGKAVSLREGTAVVGASIDDCGSSSGGAYVFRKIGEVWTEQGKLLAHGGTAGDYFGQSVSVGVDGVLVGAPNLTRRADAGSAYWIALTE